MKNSELIMLRKTYISELERISRIDVLLANDLVKEFINLAGINLDKIQASDESKILSDILKKLSFTQTNNIYVCTGAFITDCNICYQETNYYQRAVPFDDTYVEYKIYKGIEDGKETKARNPDYSSHHITNGLLIKDFENENYVLNPGNTGINENKFDIVRNEYFMNCINLGQPKSKKLILGKYRRM